MNVGRPLKYKTKCMQFIITLPENMIEQINKEITQSGINRSAYIKSIFQLRNPEEAIEREKNERALMEELKAYKEQNRLLTRQLEEMKTEIQKQNSHLSGIGQQIDSTKLFITIPVVSEVNDFMESKREELSVIYKRAKQLGEDPINKAQAWTDMFYPEMIKYLENIGKPIDKKQESVFLRALKGKIIKMIRE